MRLNPSPSRVPIVSGARHSRPKARLSQLNDQRHTGSVTKLYMNVRKRMLSPAVDAYTPVLVWVPDGWGGQIYRE